MAEKVLMGAIYAAMLKLGTIRRHLSV